MYEIQQHGIYSDSIQQYDSNQNPNQNLHQICKHQKATYGKHQQLTYNKHQQLTYGKHSQFTYGKHYSSNTKVQQSRPILYSRTLENISTANSYKICQNHEISQSLAHPKDIYNFNQPNASESSLVTQIQKGFQVQIRFIVGRILNLEQEFLKVQRKQQQQNIILNQHSKKLAIVELEEQNKRLFKQITELKDKNDELTKNVDDLQALTKEKQQIISVMHDYQKNKVEELENKIKKITNQKKDLTEKIRKANIDLTAMKTELTSEKQVTNNFKKEMVEKIENLKSSREESLINQIQSLRDSLIINKNQVQRKLELKVHEEEEKNQNLREYLNRMQMHVNVFEIKKVQAMKQAAQKKDQEARILKTKNKGLNAKISLLQGEILSLKNNFIQNKTRKSPKLEEQISLEFSSDQN